MAALSTPGVLRNFTQEDFEIAVGAPHGGSSSGPMPVNTHSTDTSPTGGTGPSSGGTGGTDTSAPSPAPAPLTFDNLAQ